MLADMAGDFPNYAFIDSQNVHLGTKGCGWVLDFSKLRRLLKEKYKVGKAYLFMGYVPGNQGLYKRLQEDGYILVFKPTLVYKDKSTKGNCDAELVLHAMIEYSNYDKALILSGDGDFYCLAEYLKNNNKLEGVVVPDKRRYSALLKKLGEPNSQRKNYIIFLDDAREKIERTPYK